MRSSFSLTKLAKPILTAGLLGRIVRPKRKSYSRPLGFLGGAALLGAAVYGYNRWRTAKEMEDDELEPDPVR